MIGMCPYVCNNKTSLGYCKTTGCINPKYNRHSNTGYVIKEILEAKLFDSNGNVLMDLLKAPVTEEK